MTETNRDKLIHILRTKEDRFLSGQALSETLGISRTAVWKHMNELKKDGYQFESVPKKGYRLIGQPSMMNESSLKWGLNTDWLGAELIFREQVDSTQTVAHELARKGAKDGTVIVANRQLKGRGRMDRKWISDDEGGIWLSMILKPPFPPHQASQITLFVAVVLVEALKKVTDLPIQIKWPNDLYIKNKKIAGILTEMQAELEVIQYLVIGFGININQNFDDFPDDIQSKSTSLRLISEQTWNRQDIIHEILHQFEQAYQHYLDDGFEAIKKKWMQYAFKLDEEIYVSTHKRSFYAIMKGITDDGALIVLNEKKEEEKIYSAEIHW